MRRWEGVCEFAAVVETQSFTAASKQLGVSTAQVSRQVTALEKRFGVKLLYRTTRNVTLTEEGRLYYQNCRQVLDGLEAAEREITNLQQKPQGKIKLTAPVTYGEKHIVPLINDFLLQHPALDITIHLTNQQLNLLDEGFDLAIRLGKLSDSSMMAKKLSARKHHVCGSSQYFDNYGIPFTLAELEKHNCLLGTFEHWRFLESGKERNIRVSGHLRCNSGEGLIDAALKGIGLIQLPDYYVQPYLKNGALISVLEQFQDNEDGIWAVYPHNRLLSPRIRMLIDYLAEKLS